MAPGHSTFQRMCINVAAVAQKLWSSLQSWHLVDIYIVLGVQSCLLIPNVGTVARFGNTTYNDDLAVYAHKHTLAHFRPIPLQGQENVVTMCPMDRHSSSAVLGAKIGRVADMAVMIGKNPKHRLVIVSSNNAGLSLLTDQIVSKNMLGLEMFDCLHMKYVTFLFTAIHSKSSHFFFFFPFVCLLGKVPLATIGHS